MLAQVRRRLIASYCGLLHLIAAYCVCIPDEVALQVAARHVLAQVRRRPRRRHGPEEHDHLQQAATGRNTPQ